MRVSLVPAFLMTAGLLMSWPGRAASAQDLALGESQPRFLYASTAQADPVEIDVRRNALLQRVVSLRMERPTVRRLLASLERQTGLKFVYGDGLPADLPVALQADSITVAAALTVILLNTDLDVVLSWGRQVVLRRVPAPAPRAQPGSVAGRVTDTKSGAPLVGAEVLLEGTRSRALTGEDGRYRLAEVAPGSYTLLVRRPGHGPARRPVTVADGQEVTLDVALDPRPTQLDEVVVTGTLVPTEVKALPTPVSVITAEQIEQQHIRTYSQLLRQVVPSLVAWEDGTRPDANTMSVRGASSLSSSQLKVYLDGVQLAHNFFSQIDPQSIERIEVIRGPQAAAIYGSDAIGGVIQIFTKRGDPSLQRLQGSAQAAVGGIQSRYRDGLTLRQDYRAELRGASGGASFNLGGGYNRDGEWIDLYGAERPSAYGGMRFEQGRFGLDLTARYYGQNYDYPFDPALKATGYSSFQTPSYTRYRGREETYGVQLRYRVTPSWQHQVIVGMDRYSYMNETYQPELRTPSDTLLGFQEIGLNRLSVAYRSSLTAHLSSALNAVVTAGFDYNLYRYSYFLFDGVRNLIGSIAAAPNALKLASRDRATNAGYFAQAQLGFRDALFLTGSARLERNSSFGDEIGTPLSPRVGLSYVQALGGVTLKLRSAYGEALKSPSSSQKTGANYGTLVTLPNPLLLPERQVGPEAGFDLVFGSRGSLGVTFYHQSAKDLVALVQLSPAGTGAIQQYQNAGRVRNEGLEVEGRVDVAGVQLTGQYAYTSSKLLEPGPNYTGVERVGEQISSVPQHTGGVTISVTPLRQLGVTAGMAYVGPRYGVDWIQLYDCLGGTGPCYDYLQNGNTRNFWNRFSGFAKFNLALNYELRPGLTPYVAVENLANSNPVEQQSTTTLPGRITTVGLRMRY